MGDAANSMDSMVWCRDNLGSLGSAVVLQGLLIRTSSGCAAPQLETGLMVKALTPFDIVVDDPKKLHLLNVRCESV